MKSRTMASQARRRCGVRTAVTAAVFFGCLRVVAAHAMSEPADGAGEQGLLCRRAVQQAEMGSSLPQFLLAGIARVEAGRADPVTGRVSPWPWTINAEGQGHFFGSKAEAIGFTRQLQARGVQSIDAGCLQINLMHHPDAFRSLEEAFDPDANARYAVKFLTALRGKTGSWDAASAWYHSADPQLGNPYRQLVVTAMAEEAKGSAFTVPSGGYTPMAWRAGLASLPGVMAGHARVVMLARPGNEALPGRANSMAASAVLAGANPGVGLGGVAAGAAMGAPQTGMMSSIGRGLAAYRSHPVATVRTSLMAVR